MGSHDATNRKGSVKDTGVKKATGNKLAPDSKGSGDISCKCIFLRYTLTGGDI